MASNHLPKSIRTTDIRIHPIMVDWHRLLHRQFLGVQHMSDDAKWILKAIAIVFLMWIVFTMT